MNPLVIIVVNYGRMSIRRVKERTASLFDEILW